MAAPSILYLNRSPTNQVFRIDGGVSATQIGPNLTLSESLTLAFWKNNYAVEFRGRLYAIFGFTNASSITVARYDEQANTWTTVYTFVLGVGGNSGAHGGLWVASPGGVPTLCGIGGTPTGTPTAFMAKTTDGTAWTTAASFGAAWGQRGNGISIGWRNVVYCATQVGEIASVDVAGFAQTYYVIAGMAAPTQGGGNFCVFRNRLFFLRYAAAGAMTLWELFGGTWVSRGALAGASATPSATTVANSHHTLFAVGNTKMVAVYIDSDGTLHGSKACDITPTSPTSFSFVDRTSSMIPTSLDPEATAAFQSHGWNAYVDNETVPGTPAIYLWHMTAQSGGSMSYFEYVDSLTTLAPGSAGVSTNMVPANSLAGGGERAWISGQLGAEFTAIVPSTSPGQIQLTTRFWGDTVYGPSGASGGRRTEVRLATTAALPANTPAGTGVGKTLTGNANGALSADSTLAVVGNRVLVKGEVAPQHNGLYTVTQVGDGVSPFILTRATDFDTASTTEVAGGAWVKVTAGTTNINTYWQMTQTTAITMEATTLPWAAVLPRVLRLRYNALENTNLSQGTLVGAVTGNQPQAIRVGSEIQQVIADGVTTVTYEWSPTADGVLNNQPIAYFQEVAVS